MFIENKNCEKCGTAYDPVKAECPNCKERNADIEKLGIPQNIYWLSVPLQIAIFLLGFVYAGMLLISSITFEVLGSIADKGLRVYVTSCAAYVIIMIAFLVIIAFNFKPLIKFLKDWKGYIWGLAFVLILMAISLVLGAILQTKNVGENNNQTLIVSYVKQYPVASILIMGIAGPIVEEMTYRVGLFSFLRRLNRVAAYIVTIIVFALIHFDFEAADMATEFWNLPSYLAAGAVFTFTYDFKGPVSSTFAHIVYNVFSLTQIALAKTGA